MSFFACLNTRQCVSISQFHMGNSYINTNVHIIFHAKNTCSIKEEDLPQIFQYIGGIIRSMSSVPYMVGGRPDHMHILATLPCTMTLADFVRTIKAGASKWIKGIDSDYKGFVWQEGYGAFSVSQSNVDIVIKYILNQKEHHKRLTTQEEFQQFLRKHGFFSE